MFFWRACRQVVGDTFPVGCKHAGKVVHPEFFAGNPDSKHPVYSTKYGIYEPNCGLENVHMSFGHDEYLYTVCKDYLPPEALYIIRYHSFYSCHTQGEYSWLLNEKDTEMMKWVKTFNQYDLYSKAEDVPSLVTTPIQPVAPPSPPSPQPSRLITPYPLITHVEYIPESYTLNVIGQHLFQAAPVPRLLEPWLGTHGPLVATVLRPPPAHAPHETYWSIQLPHPSSEFAQEELPLLLVRQDGLVYHTGKLLVCDPNGHWSCK